MTTQHPTEHLTVRTVREPTYRRVIPFVDDTDRHEAGSNGGTHTVNIPIFSADAEERATPDANGAPMFE